MTLILNVFLRSLNSFHTRNFNCIAVEALGAKVIESIFKTSACLLTFISQRFCPWSTNMHFMFLFQKHRMSRGFVVRSLEVGIEDHMF